MEAYKDEEKLRELYYEKGLSLRGIGKHFGISDETVRYWFKKHDIPRRDRVDGIFKSHMKGPVPFTIHTSGYEISIHTYKNTKDTVFVHRLVALAHSDVEDLAGKEVHHKNGIKWDNRPENLVIMPVSEHRALHHENGDIDNTSRQEKITRKDCEEIQQKYKNGATQRELAVEYDVSSPTIHRHANFVCHHKTNPDELYQK